MSNENKLLTAEEEQHRTMHCETMVQLHGSQMMLEGGICSFKKGFREGYDLATQQTAEKDERIKELEEEKVKMNHTGVILAEGYNRQKLEIEEKDACIKKLEIRVRSTTNALIHIANAPLFDVNTVKKFASKYLSDIIEDLDTVGSVEMELEAVKKDRDDMQALCTEVHNEMIDTREERDALKKQLETDFYCVERERNGYICDEGQCDKCEKAERMPDIGQTTGQDVSHKVDAIELIVQERQRQITVEGWTPAHDDQHDCEELAQAAACYAYPPQRAYPHRLEDWPFAAEWFKEGPNRMRELVKAGALIVAEIERLQRARMSKSETTAKEAGTDGIR